MFLKKIFVLMINGLPTILVDIMKHCLFPIPAILFFFPAEQFPLVNWAVRMLGVILGLIVFGNFLYYLIRSFILPFCFRFKKPLVGIDALELVKVCLKAAGKNRFRMYPLTGSTSNFIFPGGGFLITGSDLFKSISYRKDSCMATIKKDIKRVLTYYQQNGRSVMLIRDSRGILVGYTLVVPVSEFIKSRCLNGDIRVHKIQARDICSGDDYTGIVILAAVYKPDKSRPYDPELISKALGFHIQTFLGQKPALDVIFQCARQHTTDLASEGLKKLEKQSDSRLDLYSIRVINTDLDPEVAVTAMRA